MGGADLHNRLHGYSATGNMFRKRWCYLFWFCLDVRIMNSFILEKKAINHFSRTQLAFRVELTQNLIGEFSHQRRTASLGQSKAGHWSIALSKGGCKHCLNLRRQHFAEWTASTATNAFVWSTFQSTSVTNHECTRFNLVDQEIFHRFLSCLGLQTLLDFLYILSRKPSLLSLLSNEQ